jgi:hypothetical protein
MGNGWLYETLQTATNEIGQIRVQALTGSDSHEQPDPALTAMSKTMDECGQKGPEIAFTDKPSQDKPFLMSKFDSLWKKQAKLDKLSAALNSDEQGTSIGITVNAPLPEVPTDGNDDAVCMAQATECNDSISFQVVESRDINDKIDAMQEQVEVHGRPMYAYGFDCEWDTEPTASGDGRQKVGKIALAQIAYTIDSVTKALLLKLPKMQISFHIGWSLSYRF